MTTTEYHQQADGQLERFNASMISRLRYYVAEHQKDWATFDFPLTYTYNVQVHRAKKVPPFSLAINRLPPRRTAIAGPIAPRRHWIDSYLVYRLCLIHRAALLRKMADTSCKSSQALYEKEYDQHARLEPCFPASVYVFVERSRYWHPLRTALSTKDIQNSCLTARDHTRFSLSAPSTPAKIDRDGI